MDGVKMNPIGVVEEKKLVRETYAASEAEKKLLGVPAAQPLLLYRAVGCPACAGTGYAGRTAIGEIMTVSARIRAAVNRSASSDELRSIAISEGMRTIAQDARVVVMEGRTTLAEAAVSVTAATIRHSRKNSSVITSEAPRWLWTFCLSAEFFFMRRLLSTSYGTDVMVTFPLPLTLTSTVSFVSPRHWKVSHLVPV